MSPDVEKLLQGNREWAEIRLKDDPEYFERLKDFMRTADGHGVVVELVFFSSTYAETNWSYHPFNPENNVNDTRFEDWKKMNTMHNGEILKYQEALVRQHQDEGHI